MYNEKCFTCERIKEGRCSGPKFMAMTSKELVDWTLKYQKANGISNAQLAQWSDVPKSTIDGMKYRDDIRHDTIYHILKALLEGVGGKLGDNPCMLEWEDDENSEEKIAHMNEEIQSLKNVIALMEKQVKVQNRITTVLGVLLSTSVLALIAALILSHI